MDCAGLHVFVKAYARMPSSVWKPRLEPILSRAAQITHSLPPWAIPAVLAANSLSLLLYNVAGMFVTDELGALSRTVFESARTLFVWLVSALH